MTEEIIKTTISNTPSQTSQGVATKKPEENELRILPDSSWLIAITDTKDIHHISAESSLGLIKPYKPTFYIPSFVYLETFSHFVRVNKLSAKESWNRIHKFLKEINYKQSHKFAIQEVIQKYKLFARVKISKLRPADFYIVTEGIFLNAKILTFDSEMHDCVKKYYSQIYFLAEKNRTKNDLAKLVKDIQAR